MKKCCIWILALMMFASLYGCAGLGGEQTQTTTAAETTTAAPGTFPTTQAETETTTASETSAPESTVPESTDENPWTDSQPMLSAVVPMPDFGIRMTFSETDNEWTGNYTAVRFSNYSDHIARLKKAGFKHNISSSKALNTYTFSADNGEGIEVSITYARLLGTMTVTAQR